MRERQQDIEVWLQAYNEQRSHLMTAVFWEDAEANLPDSLPLAKEKWLAA